MTFNSPGLRERALYYARLIDSRKTVVLTIKQNKNGEWELLETIQSANNIQTSRKFLDLPSASFVLGMQMRKYIDNHMTVDVDPISFEKSRMVLTPLEKTKFEDKASIDIQIIAELLDLNEKDK